MKRRLKGIGRTDWNPILEHCENEDVPSKNEITGVVRESWLVMILAERTQERGVFALRVHGFDFVDEVQ